MAPRKAVPAGGPAEGAAPEGGRAAPGGADTEAARYFVYVLACSDGSLYTGITTDVVRRLREHLGTHGGARGARYTRSRRPVGLAALWETRGRPAASSLEWHVKRLSRAEKQALVAGELDAARLARGSFERVGAARVRELWDEAVSA